MHLTFNQSNSQSESARKGKGTPVRGGAGSIIGVQGVIYADDRDIVMPGQGLQGGETTTRYNLWVHFVHRHLRDTIVILGEVNHRLFLGPDYVMLAPWMELN